MKAFTQKDETFDQQIEVHNDTTKNNQFGFFLIHFFLIKYHVLLIAVYEKQQK